MKEPKKLIEAIDSLTIELINNLEHGEEVQLNDEYTLYHYCEDDIIVINETEQWEEIFQILLDGDKITLEHITNRYNLT